MTKMKKIVRRIVFRIRFGKRKDICKNIERLEKELEGLQC